jgi:tetratricopeptide (TPR) repeat protein
VFTIAEPLIELLLDDEQYMFDWLDHDRHDDPEWLGKLKAERAFLRGQTEAGLAELGRLRREHSDAFSLEDAGAIARYVGERDKVAEAQAILQWVVEADPEGTDGWVAFGRFYLERGQRREALEYLQKAIGLDPENASVKRAISWAKEVVDAQASPVAVPEKALAAYAGDYGPRHVRLRKGQLYYQRDGRDEYGLLPLSQDTFALEGLGGFRLRFVLDDEGNATKLVGLDIADDSDESPRDVPGE